MVASLITTDVVYGEAIVGGPLDILPSLAFSLMMLRLVMASWATFYYIPYYSTLYDITFYYIDSYIFKILYYMILYYMLERGPRKLVSGLLLPAPYLLRPGACH